MTRREKFTAALLKPVNKAAIVILGVYTIIWGLWVANPFWSVFDQAQLFSALGLLAPEAFWGTVAIIVGIVTVFGAYHRSYRTLVCGSTLAGWHWLMIAFFYFIGDWHNTGGITSLMLAVYAAFIYLNIRVNHYYSKKRMDEILN